ncbi:MAG TPA: acyl-CoA synthetase [Usitatibacter sp.]|nr:acyl-CoA synthetase [Usitatibacter sp.]
MSTAWRDSPERGAQTPKRIIIWLALHAGRSFCRVALVPISMYFLATAPRARRASREFLTRTIGRRATWRDCLRHLFVFATTLLDRVYLLHGRREDLEVTVVNEHVFEEAIAAGRGCLLLGSHLGSFEMLGVVGGLERRLAINMVMHLEPGGGVRELLARTGYAIPYKVIALGRPESMLRVKECLDRGEVVGILADRVYGGEVTRVLPFLGSAARFSLSPFRLARITGAPVVAVFGLFRGGRRYEIVFEALPGPEPAPYVAVLERQARRCPYNWFNFYDFWGA